MLGLGLGLGPTGLGLGLSGLDYITDTECNRTHQLQSGIQHRIKYQQETSHFINAQFNIVHTLCSKKLRPLWSSILLKCDVTVTVGPYV